MRATPAIFIEINRLAINMKNKNKGTVLDQEDIVRILRRVAHQILEKNPRVNEVCLVGIQRRGVFLAERLQKIISEIEALSVPLGIIDITLYRDDLTTVGHVPLVRETSIDFDINGKELILVDDVLYTGRTVRAALDALTDFGRPKSIQLAVLVDRGHRELPIRADYVGKNIPTSPKETVELRLTELDGCDEVVVVSHEPG